MAKRSKLARARRAAGYTQESFAEALHVDRTTVVRWEAGTNEPLPYLRPKMARLLGISLAELDKLICSVESAITDSAAAHPSDVSSETPCAPILQLDRFTAAVSNGDAMSSMDRRNFLKNSVGAIAWSALNPDEVNCVARAVEDARRYLDGTVVAAFRRQLAASMASDGAQGPTHALPTVLGLLGLIEQSARDVQMGIRQQLLSVGARAAEFAGWLYRDVHQQRMASFWYDRATEWAQEANDMPMQGYVLLKKSQMAYDDRVGLRVLAFAQAAQHGAWDLPAIVRAEVTQQEARGLAMTGESLALVERKLEAARRLFAASDADAPDHQLGTYYNDGTLTLRDASCYIEAGKPRQAAELYAEVLSTDLLTRRDRGYFLARLASALALSGEPDEAAAQGLEAAALATATSSQRTKRELMRTLQTLQPWTGRPGPRQLREAVLG